MCVCFNAYVCVCAYACEYSHVYLCVCMCMYVCVYMCLRMRVDGESDDRNNVAVAVKKPKGRLAGRDLRMCGVHVCVHGCACA